MTRNSPSIPTVVASIITRDLALYECFRRKLVNYHAVAGSIKPEVEKLAGKTTTINTIVVAITRFSETVERTAGEKPIRALGGARISLASDVVDVTIRARKTEQYEIAKRIGELSPSLSEPIRMFQLSNSIKLIADEREYDSLIRASLEKFEIIEGDDGTVEAGHPSITCGRGLSRVRAVPHRAPLQEWDQDSTDVHRRGDRPDHEQGRWSPGLRGPAGGDRREQSRIAASSQGRRAESGLPSCLIDELKGTFNTQSIGRD